MSLILDAINRAEKDRTDQPLPHGLHPDQSPDEKKRVIPWTIIAFFMACLMLLLAAVFFWYSVNKTTDNNLPAVEKIVVEKTVEEQAVVKPPVTQKSTAVELERVGDTANMVKLKPVQSSRKEVSSAITSLYEKQAKEASQPKPSPVKAVKKVKTTEEDLLIEEAQRLANEALVEELLAKKNREEREEKLLKAAKTMQLNQPSKAPQQAEDLNVPLLWDLSTQVQSTIPSLEYSDHQFSRTQSANNFIVINGRRVQEGSEVASGVTLKVIRSGHSVFSFQGREFKLNALNSWVNFD